MQQESEYAQSRRPIAPVVAGTFRDAFVGTLVLLVAVAVGFLGDPVPGRQLELVLVGIGTFLAYRAGWTYGRAVALVIAAVYLLVEASYGRLDGEHYWRHVLFVSGIIGAALSAAYFRLTTEAQTSEIGRSLAAAGEAENHEGMERRLSRPHPLRPIEYELERSRRHSHELTLLLVRPDELEDIAARYGEHGIRQALGSTADTIAANIRATDLRLTADEIESAVLLPETPISAGRTVAERIRLAAAEVTLEFGPGELVELPVSIGAAGFPLDATTNDALVGAARRALERASLLGGNRTVMHSVPLDAPAGWGIERRAPGAAGTLPV